MTNYFNKLLQSYHYSLPKDLIALEPVSPRDSARLLVMNKKNNGLSFDYFFNLGRYLPPKSLLVFNDTKVLPARLKLFKPTGGVVKVLYLRSVKGLVEVMSDKKLTVGQKLFLNKKVFFTVISEAGGTYFLKPPVKAADIYLLLIKYGLTPLPPYLKASRLNESRRRQLYQTVFARDLGSVAAPTASLHFTKKLLSNLKKQGHQIRFVTLHVNLGTFASLKPNQVKQKKLHSEFWQVSGETIRAIKQARKQRRKIVAVGTTVVRTLESAFAETRIGLKTKSGQTTLFISPGYKFKAVDCLITNFHVPSSSLMMLVAAMITRRRLLNVYKQAIKKKFRFFSFGDGMLIK